MSSPVNAKKNTNWRLILLLLFVALLLQAFIFPEFATKTHNIANGMHQENKQDEWLQKWNSENIGKGFFLPESESHNGSQRSNNVLKILMNRNGEFLIENQFVEKEEVKQTVKDFLNGTTPDGRKGPDYTRKDIPLLGKVKISKGLVSYKHDLASSNDMVNYTLRSIGEAYLELKNETAQLIFENNYIELDEEKQQAIDEALPIRFFYELPNPPTPSVWLPFDRKPSKPDPINISLKVDGSVIVENYKFNTFDEFVGNLTYWKEQLNEFNKKQKVKGQYRANIVFEDISKSDPKNIHYLLQKNDVHVERSFSDSNIRGRTMLVDILPDSDASNLENTLRTVKRDFQVYNEKLRIIIQYHEGVTFEQVKSARDSFLALGIENIEVKKYVKPSAPLFLLALHANEIQNVFREAVPLDSISNYAEQWLQNVGAEYSARIDVYQNVSEEQIQELKLAMQSGGITNDILINKLDQQ